MDDLFFVPIDNYPEPEEVGEEEEETGPPIEVTGSADVYGVVYAPNGTVTVTDQAEVYGKKLVVNGDGAIHFDEQLLQAPGIPQGDGDQAGNWTEGPGGFDTSGEAALVSWREVAVPQPGPPDLP